jgi:transcriptional regulator with XRE-family HTH domain
VKWDGTKLKELVKAKGFSITRAAEELDVSRQAFTSWTNDQVPKGSHLVRLSRVLDVEPGYFFTDEPSTVVTAPLHRKRGKPKG